MMTSIVETGSNPCLMQCCMDTRRLSMATKLTKPVTRETDVTVFDRGNREIIVTLQGDCIVFKLKGLRSTYELQLGEAFWIAFKKRSKL